jgi:flagellar basal-body rod protein FlgC
MSDACNAALSALGAFFRKIDVTANNIANSETNNFKKSRVEMEEVYPSGVKVSISRIGTPGDPLPPDEALPPEERAQNLESSNVNVVEQLVNLIVTEHDFSANIKTIQTKDEMEKQLIDIIA